MKKIKAFTVPVFVIAIFSLFAIASSPSHHTFKNGAKWIPSEFNPNKQVLLVEKLAHDNTEEKAEAYMAEKYPYKYQFVPAGDIYNSDKYSDLEKYRFALVRWKDEFSMTTEYSNGSSRTVSGQGTDFGFYDRKLKKMGPKAGKGSSNVLMTFKPIINTIVKDAEQ